MNKQTVKIDAVWRNVRFRGFSGLKPSADISSTVPLTTAPPLEPCLWALAGAVCFSCVFLRAPARRAACISGLPRTSPSFLLLPLPFSPSAAFHRHQRAWKWSEVCVYIYIYIERETERNVSRWHSDGTKHAPTLTIWSKSPVFSNVVAQFRAC